MTNVFFLRYAFVPTLYNGRCYNYGCPKLTSGLTEVTNYHANTKKWMAASGEMEDISGIAGVTNNNDATCYKKLYAGIDRFQDFFFVCKIALFRSNTKHGLVFAKSGLISPSL